MPSVNPTARFSNRASDGLYYSNRERNWRRARGWWVSYDEAEQLDVTGQKMREAARVRDVRQTQAAERIADLRARNVERVTNAPPNVEAEYEEAVAAGVPADQPAHAVGLGRRRRIKGKGTKISIMPFPRPSTTPMMGGRRRVIQLGSGHKQSIQLGGIVMPENRPIGGILGRFIAY